MALTALQIIEARAPHLSGEARVSDLLQVAATLISASVYGNLYQQAIALQVLHWLVADTKQGAPGPVTSESEGSVSRSYGWSGVYGELSTTSYGLELLGLRARVVVTPLNRMICDE